MKGKTRGAIATSILKAGVLALILTIALAGIGCGPTAEVRAVVIRDRNVCVEINKNDSIRIEKVIIDGNEVLLGELTESKANNTWVAKMPVSKTPHIKAWMERNTRNAKEALEKAQYDYAVFVYDMYEQRRVFDPRLTAKLQEYEQRVLEAEGELSKWDTLFNKGLPTNWLNELRGYVTVEASREE